LGSANAAVELPSNAIESNTTRPALVKRELNFVFISFLLLGSGVLPFTG